MSDVHPPTTSGQHNDSGESALFQCATCKKKFGRVDHLTRHVRSHTQTRPYHCSICPKQFARIDILKRHVAGHDSTQEGSVKRRKVRNGEAAAAARASRACVTCAADHLKCSEEKPCRRCVEKNMACHWQRAGTDQDNGHETPEAKKQGGAMSDTEAQTLPLPFENGHESLPMNLEIQDETITHSNYDFPILSDTMKTMLPLDGLAGTWTPRGLPEFGFETSIDLNDLDLAFLNAYNTQIPFDFGDTPITDVEYPGTVDSGCSAQAEIGAAAFRKSHWRFRPNHQDHGAAEQANLSLPTDHESPESRIMLLKRATSAKLTASSRDKVLAMVLDSCDPENRHRVVDFFPSAELLDIMIQYCLSSQVARVYEIISLGAFNPNKTRPELLAAIIAYGCVLTADSALSKLGFAIQECVRTSVPKHWERNNTQIRDLELAQAFMIVLEIGMWSGNSRKMEISESFLQPLLTMMRRGGKFRASTYPEQDTFDGNTHFPEEWESWAAKESFKRLIFRILQHDTHVSMALLVPPLISYNEVQLSFPEPQEVWLAPSAEVWQSRRARNGMGEKVPSLVNYLNDLNCLDRFQGMYDHRSAQFAFLSGAWRLVWEQIQLQSLRKNQSRHSLLLASRHEELLKMIEQFRLSLDLETQSQLSPDIHMEVELILTHLHTPLEEIQLLAGIEGPEEARQVLPFLKDWAISSSARRAIWHSGQVLHAARNFPSTSIRFFPAVGIYHAALSFWAYGLILKDAQVTTGRAYSSDLVVPMDGLEDSHVQRFIQIERGSPAICAVLFDGGNRSTKMVPLIDPSEVMKTMIAVFHSNYGQQETPVLVKNLIQLMSGLQSAAETSIS